MLIRLQPSSSAILMRSVLLFLLLRFYTLSSCAPLDCPLPPFEIPSSIPSPYPSELAEAMEAIDALLTAEIASGALPNVYVAITFGNQTIFSKGYGLVNTTDAEGRTTLSQPTSRNIYPIASNTKTFTGLLMMQLRDRGYVDLDAPITRYLPAFSVSNPYFPTTRSITLRALSSHLSGLPRDTPCDPLHCDLSNSEMMERISQLDLLMPPYTVPLYSNLAVSLLGHALAAAITGDAETSSYETLLLNNVIAPLRMIDTAFVLTPEQMSRLPSSPSSPSNGTPPWDSASWDTPSGGLYSTADDLLLYLQALLSSSNPSTNVNPVVDGWTAREWLSEQIYVFPNGRYAIGMPWENKRLYGMWTNYKGGQLPGYTTGMWLIPQLNTAFTVLTTSSMEPFISPEIAAILIPAMKSYLESVQPKNLLPPSPEAYLGTYRAPGGHELTLSLRNESGYEFIALDIRMPPYPMIRFISHNDQSHVSTFRLTPYPNEVRPPVDSCYYLDGGIYYEYAYFQLNSVGTFAESLTLPGLSYSLTYQKVIE